MNDGDSARASTRLCAVCGRVLDHLVRISTGEFAGWRHGESDQPEDHPAVPVEPTAVPGRYRCDFCHADDPRWTLPVRSFELADVPNAGSLTDWAACDDCAALIRRNQWTRLVTRAAASFTDRQGYEQDLQVRLGRMFRQLRTNITGPLRAAREEDTW